MSIHFLFRWFFGAPSKCRTPYSFQTISTVAQLVGHPWSTVRNFLARSGDRRSIENATRSGRRALLRRRERRAIIRAARTDRAMTWLELRNRYAPHVSIRTIDRVLREANRNLLLSIARFPEGDPAILQGQGGEASMDISTRGITKFRV